MVKYVFQHKIILTLILILVLMAVFVSACNLINLGGGEAETGPATSTILAPVPGAKVLQGAPVQILSAYTATNISRVELSIQGPGTQTSKLIRSDIPINQTVLQQWTPEQAGIYTITVRAYVNNDPVIAPTRTLEVITDDTISLVPVAAVQAAAPSGLVQPTVIPATPLPLAPGDAAFAPPEQAAVIQVVATTTAEPAPTPTPFYPPPPPIPGIPPGPVQFPGLNVHPPVCDDAKYLGPFASNTSRRVVITEPDELAPKVVGGTLVHRVWRLQNVGTCTWGPGYELAFYGGRSMGSGGVAFEAPFPPNPPRRNTLLDTNRLIVPEGKPNQVAVLEVALLAPVTPGIHQSYWRMRNPHGVFFGPIIGVTMDVVRDCAFGIYGAPVINRFEILGYGNVYRPTDPVNIRAEVGKTITLDYNIINATNFDIVFEDPTGNVQTVSSSDQSGRFSFPAQRLGRNTITLYADNGSCTVQAQVNVDVIPRSGEQFELDIILASSAPVSSADPNVAFSTAVAPGTLKAEWQHFDPEVNEVIFHADLYQRRRTQQCLIEGWLCGDTTGDWELVRRSTPEQVGSEAEGAATVCVAGSRCASRLPTEIAGAQQAQQPLSAAEHRILLGCPANTGNDPTVEYGIGYYVEALISNVPADPPRSNQAFVSCAQDASTAGLFTAPLPDTTPSCTLTQLGGITLPLACKDVPIVAGVGLVILLAVGWFFFK